MKKTKIIHILCHLPNPVILNYSNPLDYFKTSEFGEYHELNSPPYWVGFFSQDHHVIAAKELLSHTDEFDVECWRPYGYGLKEPHEEIVNGIKHKVFPAKVYYIPQIGSLTWSRSLLKALVNEIHTNNIILNISVGHVWFHILLSHCLKRYKNKFALVAIHRSGGFKRYHYFQLKSWKKFIKWYYLLENEIDIRSIKSYDHYFIGAIPEAKYLRKLYPEISSSFLMEGIDFSKYQVLTIEEKTILRKKLGLPLDKKILIACGNWKSKDYEYQHLLDCYKEIIQNYKIKDLQLLMIGGYKGEDLYQMGIDCGAIMIERVEKSLFIQYLQASDFFTQANFNYGFINFGGFGTAPIEALACGIPIISNNIVHFPGTADEIKQIGMDMPTRNDLIRNIIEMKGKLGSYSKCREVAEKYYRIEDTREILLNKYRELREKYFSVH